MTTWNFIEYNIITGGHMPSTNFIVAIWSPWHHIHLQLSSIVTCLKITLILVLFPLWCLNKSISLSLSLSYGGVTFCHHSQSIVLSVFMHFVYFFKNKFINFFAENMVGYIWTVYSLHYKRKIWKLWYKWNWWWYCAGQTLWGMGILIRKSYQKHAEFHIFNDSRIVGITLCIDNLQYDFISVDRFYQCDANYDLYLQCIGKLSTLIKYSYTNNIVILSDFNATLNSVFKGELLEICSTFDLVISDYGAFGRTSGQFINVSDAHGTTS